MNTPRFKGRKKILSALLILLMLGGFGVIVTTSAGCNSQSSNKRKKKKKRKKVGNYQKYTKKAKKLVSQASPVVSRAGDGMADPNRNNAAMESKLQGAMDKLGAANEAYAKAGEIWEKTYPNKTPSFSKEQAHCVELIKQCREFLKEVR